MAIIILPVALEPPESQQYPARAATVVWMMVALIAMHLVVVQLVNLDHQRHWGLVGDHVFRVVTFTSSIWSLYSDPALFTPWQLWTYALINDNVVEALINLLMLAVVGRAVERWIGGMAFIGAVMTLIPLAAVIHLLIANRDDTILTGADGLAAGVLGMAWALFPNGRVRWGLAYFAIVMLGYVPLFRLSLVWIAILFFAGVGLVHGHDGPVNQLLSDLAALLAGVVLGLAGRRVRQYPTPTPR
jgi:membrane associated rhomboid family serine protease